MIIRGLSDFYKKTKTLLQIIPPIPSVKSILWHTLSCWPNVFCIMKLSFCATFCLLCSPRNGYSMIYILYFFVHIFYHHFTKFTCGEICLWIIAFSLLNFSEQMWNITDISKNEILPTSLDFYYLKPRPKVFVLRNSIAYIWLWVVNVQQCIAVVWYHWTQGYRLCSAVKDPFPKSWDRGHEIFLTTDWFCT